jgi:hypothetical protein
MTVPSGPSAYVVRLRSRKQWDTLHQQLHERFDQWIDTPEKQLHEVYRKCSATRQGWSKGIGGGDAFMKLCASSSGCKARLAQGEPA